MSSSAAKKQSFVLLLGTAFIVSVTGLAAADNERVWLTLAIALFSAVLVMSILFVIAQRKERYDYVDVGWGLSITTITAVSYLLSRQPVSLYRLAALLLVGVWGVRLAAHVWRRIVASKQEDQRYVALRARWNTATPSAIYQRIYLVQSVLALFVALPAFYVQHSHVVWPAVYWLGVAVALFGLIFEIVADYQLKKFLGQQQGKPGLMTSGLWRYSRHPNYFGELSFWWGISLTCLASSYGWIGLVGAILITYLIVYISGVPLAEVRAAKRPGWKAYAARTRALVPLPRLLF